MRAILSDIRSRVMSRVWLRLLVLMGATLIGVSTVLLVFVVGFYAQRIETEQARAAAQVGALLQASLERAMLARDIAALETSISDLARAPGVARVMILNPDREVRFSSDQGLVGRTLPSDTPAPDSEQTRSERAVQNRAACATCHGPPATYPVNGFLVVDHTTGDLRAEALTNAVGLAFLGGVATLAASVVLALGMRRIVGQPIAALSNAVEAMAAGRRDVQLTPKGLDEIARLGHSFNRMTERIDAEQQALAQAEREAQALIDAIPDGVRVIGPDYRIRRANTAYSTQVGRPLSEIRGAYCYASSHGRDAPCEWTLVTCPVHEMAQKRRKLTFRDYHRAPAGRQIAVEVSAAALNHDVVEAIRDLDAETRISQAQKLSELGQLATGVAHEIHNPLNAIELALGALKRDVRQGQTDGAQESISLIRGEISRCLDITDNLLRLGAPSGAVAQLLDLNKVASGVMRLLAWQAESRSITVEQAIPPGLRVLIGDSDLHMALTNLALNAIHAMPQGGRLTLAAHRADGQIELSVSDTGVGIPAADLDNIFMPFWSRRADATTGRGLGLSITRAIVERAHARITAESEPGRGSRFTITFRDADAEPPLKQNGSLT